VFFAFACFALAGGCYLVSSFTHFMDPAFAARLFPALFVPIFVAEASLAVWLLVKGVDVARWEALG
jgi:hypothetical protein